MTTDCEAWLNANPVESADLSDSFGSEDEDGNKNLKEINGNWLSSTTSTATSSLQEARLRAKAKRRLRKTSSRDSGRGDSLSDTGDGLRGTPAPPGSPKSKLLDRKSRHGKGRGLPKKGGAGGKGVWGRSGEVYGPEQVDEKDPNYDEAQLVGQFIARAVLDQILPRSYIEGYKGRVDCEWARAALDRAAVLLKMSLGGLRIDNHWGSGGGLRPLTLLIKEMNLLLKEFILSGDPEEAQRCLRDLEVPHFHHEFVYEAIVMVLESKGEKTFSMVLQLLQSLANSSVITGDQIRRGYDRVYMDIADINIDVPRAYFILEQFVEQSFIIGIIDVKLRDDCPCRGRKRFVSEGDGGAVKVESC